MPDEIPGIRDGEGEGLPVRAFSLQESIRLGKNPKVQALIASMAAHSDRYIGLRELSDVEPDGPLRQEAVDGLCAALDGHDEILIAMTAIAADRSADAVRNMPANNQAVLVLSMIAHNDGFFRRRMAKEYQRQMQTRPAVANADE